LTFTLSAAHIEELNRLVSACLDLAENRARRGIVTRMSGWITFLHSFLELPIQAPVDSPIINSPYYDPLLHWSYSKEGRNAVKTSAKARASYFWTTRKAISIRLIWISPNGNNLSPRIRTTCKKTPDFKTHPSLSCRFGPGMPGGLLGSFGGVSRTRTKSLVEKRIAV